VRIAIAWISLILTVIGIDMTKKIDVTKLNDQQKRAVQYG